VGSASSGQSPGQNEHMTSPHQPHAPNVPDGPRWCVKPALISVMNIAAVLVVVTFLIGWSSTTVAVVLVGIALGTWWLVQQRPRAEEAH
jgi:Flp pilus assembly protein TadB